MSVFGDTDMPFTAAGITEDEYRYIMRLIIPRFNEVNSLFYEEAIPNLTDDELPVDNL